MKAELVPDNGDPPIRIVKDLTVIGRREYCDVHIDDPSLSKRHAVIVKTDGLLVIRDLVTTNGTKVKGQRIRWAALLPDDKITLGGYKLRVYLGPDDAPGPSEMESRRERPGRKALPVADAVPPGPRGKGKAKAKAGGVVDPPSGFPPPSPIGLAAVGAKDADELEILGPAEDDESDWRRLISTNNNGDLIIELE